MEQSGNLIVAKQSRAEYDFVLKGTGSSLSRRRQSR